MRKSADANPSPFGWKWCSNEIRDHSEIFYSNTLAKHFSHGFIKCFKPLIYSVDDYYCNWLYDEIKTLTAFLCYDWGHQAILSSINFNVTLWWHRLVFILFHFKFSDLSQFLIRTFDLQKFVRFSPVNSCHKNILKWCIKTTFFSSMFIAMTSMPEACP